MTLTDNEKRALIAQLDEEARAQDRGGPYTAGLCRRAADALRATMSRPMSEAGKTGQKVAFRDKAGDYDVGEWETEGRAWIQGYGFVDVETLRRRYVAWLPLPTARPPIPTEGA